MDEFSVEKVASNEVAAVWDELRHTYDPPIMRGYDFDSYVAKLVAHAITLKLDAAGVLAGAISFYANDAEGGIAYITNVAVAAPFAGRRLAERLMRAAANVSMERGMRTMRLEVRRDNARALALYRRLGFEEEPGNHDAPTIYMKIPLDALTV